MVNGLDKLKPPGVSDLNWWRVTVSLSTVTILVWISWAMGAFTGMGFPGLARAGNVENVLARVTELQIGEIEGKILATQRDWCSSPLGSRARAFFLERRQLLLADYFDLTKRPYQSLPTCMDLGLQ